MSDNHAHKKKKEGLLQQKRERGGRREGRGNECKKTGTEKRVKKMHKSCISSRLQGTKNIVFVNGWWWDQAQGECNEKPGRRWLLVLLSTNPLCQLGWALVWFRTGWRLLIRILSFNVLGICCWRGFERAVISDWTQCATWRRLRLLLDGLLPSLLSLALFGLWSWLSSRASPRCWATAVWGGWACKRQHGSQTDEMVSFFCVAV